MVTLYGYKRVPKDDLPTPNGEQMLWKDGIGAIDEHLNGFQQWGLPHRIILCMASIPPCLGTE